MASPSNSSAAERLKTEGNTLYRQGDYKAAYQKFSEAMNESTDKAVLAILYSNRAASSLALKEYLDAMHDGREATKSDPRYPKGWARMGKAAEAMGTWDVARNAWLSALSCLPAADLSAAESAMKAQFEAALKVSNAAERKRKTQIETGKYTTSYPGSQANLPWNRALELAKQNKLERGATPSSGFVILRAVGEFIDGVQMLKDLVVTDRGQKLVMSGTFGALANMTNGLLTDPRAFHGDSSDFLQKIQYQIRLEAREVNAWGSGGPKQVQKEAPERLEKLGWTPVRKALAVTVRAWMMIAFIESNTGSLTSAVEYYRRAIDVLEWGRHTYRNVSSVDRGAVFEPTFVRGIRRLFIPAVVSLYLAEGAESGYSLDDIAQMARDLKTETEMSRIPPSVEPDEGMRAAYWIYPVAEGLSWLGWYHMQLGLQHLDDEMDESEDPANNFVQSAEYYIEAAEKYPTDDEYHPYLLAVALEALWWSNAPLRTTLPLCRKIRVAMPKAAKIWVQSQMSITGKTARCQDALDFLDDCVGKLARGSVTLDSRERPADMILRHAKQKAKLREELKSHVGSLNMM